MWKAEATTTSREAKPEPVKLDRPADDGQLAGVSSLDSPTGSMSNSKLGLVSVHTSLESQREEEHLVGPVSTAVIKVLGRCCQAVLDTWSQVTTVTDEFVSSHLELRHLQLVLVAGVFPIKDTSI